jgi:hypothetical protein
MGTSAQRRKAGRERNDSFALLLTEQLNKRGAAQLARKNIHPVLADEKLEQKKKKRKLMDDSVQESFRNS